MSELPTLPDSAGDSQKMFLSPDLQTPSKNLRHLDNTIKEILDLK